MSDPANMRLHLLLALLLAGCTSSASVTRLNIFLISLSYQLKDSPGAPTQVNPGIADTFRSLSNDTSLEARAGYFGVCMKHSGGAWVCSRDASNLAKLLQPDQDPANLLWQIAIFKDTIVFYGFM